MVFCNQGMQKTISERTAVKQMGYILLSFSRYTLGLMVSNNRALFKCNKCLPGYCHWPCLSLYDHNLPILQDNTSVVSFVSQSSDQLRLFSRTWPWVHCNQTASTVSRSRPLSTRAALRCGGMGDLYYLYFLQMTNLQISNCVMLSCP